MTRLVELAKHRPEFVQLLHLYKFFPTVEALENARSFTRQRMLGHIAVLSEAGCQVDTHMVESNIDEKYHWNEWQLRRDAVMLVNLRDKKTHGSQTNESHFKRDSETQVYEQKFVESQTSKSSHTNVPRTTHYLKGLRNDGKRIAKGLYEPFGAQKLPFSVVDLTLDLDGSPVPYGKSN